MKQLSNKNSRNFLLREWLDESIGENTRHIVAVIGLSQSYMDSMAIISPMVSSSRCLYNSDECDVSATTEI